MEIEEGWRRRVYPGCAAQECAGGRKGRTWRSHLCRRVKERMQRAGAMVPAEATGMPSPLISARVRKLMSGKRVRRKFGVPVCAKSAQDAEGIRFEWAERGFVAGKGVNGLEERFHAEV
jgi:hypothetical protein